MTIEWREWNEAAIAQAQAANKPIFLTSGFFACYWCHVMEHKVYGDSALAEVINREFIPIHIDRDLRPDVDELMLRARQLITQQSGWRNHVFLTPEGLPFLACGVMLPQQGRDLTTLAQEVAQRWKESEAPLREAAGHIASIIRDELSVEVMQGDGTPDRTVAEKFVTYLTQHFDAGCGSFYGEMKFPHENYLLFLLADYRHRKDDEALQMAQLSLKKMAAGGMHDAVGGGFHRYCTDREWRAPHFEKMLYTQTLLARCYTELYAVTGKAYHRDIAEATLDFVLRDMRSPQGLFYAAIDAETQGVEGAFYVWEEDDLRSLLSPQERELFVRCYGLADLPTQPGHAPAPGKVLYARQHLVGLANEKNRSYESLRDSLKPIFAKLKVAREARTPPQTDTKILTAWNALAIDSLARAGTAFERADYLAAAVNAAERLCDSVEKHGMVLRAAEGEIHGFLEDYAYLEAALITLYKTTQDRKWLTHALDLHRRTDDIFWDAQQGGYFMTDGTENLFVRIHKCRDGGLPSPNGVMLHNLMRLWKITEDEGWLARARVIMAVYDKSMKAMPADYSTMIQAMLYLYDGAK